MATLCASFPPFACTLARLDRFAEIGVLYVAPEPTEPFLALYQALHARFPEPPDRHPSVVFHLTLAGHHPSDLDRLEAAFDRDYGACLPIHAIARELSLYQQRNEQWFKAASFPLGQDTPAAPIIYQISLGREMRRIEELNPSKRYNPAVAAPGMRAC